MTNEHDNNQEGKLPSYADLQLDQNAFDEKLTNLSDYKDNKTQAQYIKEFLLLVNKPFPAKWLKDVKVGEKRTIKYAPIDKIEFLLTRVFGAFWRREILFEGVFMNTVVCRVRLHYKIPGTSIWLYHDGAGGSPIKVSSGAAASDLTQILSGAVQQAYPASASFALSNAAEKLGELFGRNLNKDKAISFDGTYDPYQVNLPPDDSNNGNGVHIEMPNVTLNPTSNGSVTVIEPTTTPEPTIEF